MTFAILHRESSRPCRGQNSGTPLYETSHATSDKQQGDGPNSNRNRTEHLLKSFWAAAAAAAVARSSSTRSSSIRMLLMLLLAPPLVSIYAAAHAGANTGANAAAKSKAKAKATAATATAAAAALNLIHLASSNSPALQAGTSRNISHSQSQPHTVTKDPPQQAGSLLTTMTSKAVAQQIRQLVTGWTFKSCWQFGSHALGQATATNCRYPEACRAGHSAAYLLIDSQCARQDQHQTSTSMAEHGVASLAVFPRSPRQGQLGIPKADIHSYSTYLPPQIKPSKRQCAAHGCRYQLADGFSALMLATLGTCRLDF